MANGHANTKQIETRLFIDGKFQDSSDGQTFELVSPFTRQLVAQVAEASEADTNAAVAAARAAQPSWAAKSPRERGEHLRQFAALVRQNVDELARLEAMAMGKPVSQFRDADKCADKLETAAEMGWFGHGKTSLNTPGFWSMTVRQPFGVVAAIIPWNAPCIFFGGKVGLALSAGNTVVLKSSEKAPLTSIKLAELSVKAGFPPGVLNVLSGHGTPSGAVLSAHMDVRALSFTGSARTGRLIQQSAAKSNLKKVILELGGKSPAVVFEDADLDKAVPDLAASIRTYSGQLCMASSRVYVHEKIAPAFIEKFKETLGSYKAGDPLDASTTHGPQADEVQYNNVKNYISGGKESGKLVMGGEENGSDGGYFIAPSIFTDTPEDAKIMKEEIFGSVVNINTFKTEEEALAKANDSEYGLYASVYTENIDRALRFAKGFEAGTVGVNCTSPTTVHDMPFGGWKSSGQDREGMQESLDHYLEIKTVLIKTG